MEAWNSHDLDRIMSHYADDFQMTSPFIVTMMNEPTGTIKGKENVRAYWFKALERLPDLHFDLIEALGERGQHYHLLSCRSRQACRRGAFFQRERQGQTSHRPL